MKKAVLLDVSAIMYRAYYSLMNMTNSKGEPTGAVYGFANMLLGIIDEFKPDYICAAYDVKRSSLKRSEKFENYKADRKPMPEDLLKQLPFIEELIKGFGIKGFTVEGHEADDVLGTLAKKFSEKNIESYVITGDKDLSQIIDEYINIALLGKGEGNNRFKIISTDEDVIEQLGVKSHEIPDLFGLIGDSSDGIPGVRKVGIKKAVPMLQKYTNLEGIYENVDKLSEIPGIGKGLIQNIIEDKEIAFMSRELAIIETALPIDIKEDELSAVMDREGLYRLFEELEIKTMIKKLALEEPSTKSDKAENKITKKTIRNRAIIKTQDDLINAKTQLASAKRIAIFWNEAGFAFCDEEKSYYLPLSHHYLGAVNFDRKDAQSVLDIDTSFVAYKFKEILNKKYKIKNIELDISLASYLLTANTKEELEAIIETEIGDRLKSYSDIFDKSDIHHCQIDQMGNFAFERVEAVYNMSDSLKEKLERESLDKLYYEIELPLLRVLSNMETTGIKINTGYFSKYGKELGAKIDNLVPLIYKESRESIKKNYELMEISEFNIIEKYQELGQLMYKKKSELYAFNREFDNLSIEELLEYEMKFNIASPKQLGIIFFDLMKLPVVKKTKSGYSVNEEVLDYLREKGYQIADYLLEYRKLTKLLSTYVEALPKLVDSDDRIHTTYNQSGTATGRLSSSEPNLQNIPSRSEEGIKIREGFIPKEGYSLIAFDYSQIELRILAEVSLDKNLIDAYKNNMDLHDLTARKLFELGEKDEITREQRAVAKIVNFSIIYGKTAFGLAKELGISNEDAKLYIKRYFSQYPDVKKLENQIISDAKEKGYVRTLFNRRRMIPEIKSTNKNIQQQGERMAVNTVIQGTAADVLKIVMIKIFDFIKEKEDITMNLQVHDELLFEVKDESIDFYIEKIKNIMENTIKLENVVLKTNVAYGKNWSEAK